MNKEKKKKRKVSLWKQLLISIIGTAIGVGLTFAVNNCTSFSGISSILLLSCMNSFLCVFHYPM